jgi:hypothetical protein
VTAKQNITILLKISILANISTGLGPDFPPHHAINNAEMENRAHPPKTTQATPLRVVNPFGSSAKTLIRPPRSRTPPRVRSAKLPIQSVPIAQVRLAKFIFMHLIQHRTLIAI